MPTTLWSAGVCLALVTYLTSTARIAPSPAGELFVESGGDLQAAIDSARPGETILLERGATYVGNFALPGRSGGDTRPIVLRTRGPDPVAQGERLSPEHASALAKIRSPNGSPALATRSGARFWTIALVEFLPTRNGVNDIIALGSGSDAQRSLDMVPSDLILDRVYIHGDERQGQKRGIALNSARTTIRNSHVSHIKAEGQDSQAIAGWNGPGPYLIENSYIEGAGENILFGGADPAILDLVPTDIVIRGNTIAKPVEWKTQGQPWQVKNLLELKNARRVVIEQNIFERNWAQAQSGYAILFTVRNQDGGCRWCEVADVRFEQNVVRDVAAGFNILGVDYLNPSRQTSGIVIRHNLFDGLDARQWGGDGYLLQLLDGPRDIVVDHNTVIQGESGGIAKIDGIVEGFTFTNNITGHGAYGIIASSRRPGNDSIRASLPGARIVNNVIADADGGVYPPGNMFPSMEELRRQFVNADARDFRLLGNSPWVTGSTAGGVLGALFNQPAGQGGSSATGSGGTRGRFPRGGR